MLLFIVHLFGLLVASKYRWWSVILELHELLSNEFCCLKVMKSNLNWKIFAELEVISNISFAGTSWRYEDYYMLHKILQQVLIHKFNMNILSLIRHPGRSSPRFCIASIRGSSNQSLTNQEAEVLLKQMSC